MNCDSLGEQIAKFRKAQGLTQEDLAKSVGVSSQAVSRWECGGAPDVTLLPAIADRLGVTIDALFGREGGERVDVEQAVGRWLRSFPEEERMGRLCRVVWSSLSCFYPLDIEMPKMNYISSCWAGLEEKRQIMYTQIRSRGGALLDVHAEDLSFVTLWPEPKEGYAAYLDSIENFRGLFALLAKPGCLELLEELSRRKPQYFIPIVVARRLDMPLETVTELLDELEKRKVLWSTKMELEDGEVKAYQLIEPINLVPLLYTAQSFMQTGLNYMYYFNDELPLLRGAKWKTQEDNRHEKKE